MSQTGRMRFVIIFIVVLIGVGGFLYIRNASSDLLKKSIYLTDKVGDALYYWLTNEELLYLTPNQMAGTYALHRLKIASGVDETQGNLKSGNFRISPDGQWALTITPSNAGSLFSLERTDGKRQFRFYTHLNNEDINTNIAWTTDDKAIIALTFSDTGGLLTTFPLDKPAVLPDVPNSLTDNQILLGVTDAGRVLAIQNISDKQLTRLHDSITLYDFPLKQGSDVHKIDVSRPEGRDSEVEDVVLNPSGSRLAWRFTAHHTPLLYGALKRLYNVFGVYDNTSVSLWTSKTDGSEMHELGSINLNSPVPQPQLLRWTPDGRNLSFKNDEKLYSIPATK